jgi:hypothetical protein
MSKLFNTKAMALWRHMTQSIFRSGVECLEGVMLCAMPCLHVWFAQTAVKQNKGWAIWYFIFILKKEKWILCGYKVLALECVAADTWQALDTFCVSLGFSGHLEHTEAIWVSAVAWQGLDPCSVCRGFIWYFTSLRHILCLLLCLLL